MTWDEYFIKIARVVAEKSKDNSTQVGAVIVSPNHEILSTGFNGFPRGIDELDDERWERPQKYDWVEHAERNAIYNAARNGVQTNGATLYLNWRPIPCINCAKAIIQAGIKEIVGPDVPFGGKGEQWNDEMTFAKRMLLEAGVELIEHYE